MISMANGEKKHHIPCASHLIFIPILKDIFIYATLQVQIKDVVYAS